MNDKGLLFTFAVLRLVSKMALVVKNLPANAGDLKDVGLIPGLGRSLGGGHGNPLQYYFLENPMDRRAWQATVDRAFTLYPELNFQQSCF